MGKALGLLPAGQGGVFHDQRFSGIFALMEVQGLREVMSSAPLIGKAALSAGTSRPAVVCSDTPSLR